MRLTRQETQSTIMVLFFGPRCTLISTHCVLSLLQHMLWNSLVHNALRVRPTLTVHCLTLLVGDKKGYHCHYRTNYLEKTVHKISSSFVHKFLSYLAKKWQRS